MHALIIENEYFVAELIEDALRHIGYTSFSVAMGADEAAACAGALCPDIIIAEHRLADGPAIAAVLEVCSGRQMPVVFVTAAAPEVRKRLPDAVVVQKPFLTTGLQIAAAEAARTPYCR